ncbi:MAG: beta-N-acetylhexosaminidase [Treponema sp.]|jgi:hexosaminidase|nr:beta-N-acetylhexosaminidase [Treponema sp.]
MNELNLIPQPVSIRYKDGCFQCAELPSASGDAAFKNELAVFSEQMAALGRLSASALIECRHDAGLASEAYRLSITPQNIALTAATGAGAYHGLQSLRQLILSGITGAGAVSIPCADIEDAPRFPWRGFMLDTARYFYSIDFTKKLIDALSLHHISRFHWHLTDDQGWRLPVKEYPLLTEIGSRKLSVRHQPRDARYIGGFYTEDEIRDLVAYAAARHIEVVPEVDLPGHASAILAAYPGLGCSGGPYRVEDRFGIFEDVLCAGNDAIFDLGDAVFNTLARLFPSPYVHIGGDEVLYNHWQKCPKCQKRLVETGLQSPRELQSWITVRLARMLATRGKTAIGWDEVLEDSAQYPLPKDVVVMSWRGTKGGIEASRLGHDVIMTPNTEGCYFDYKYRKDPEEPGQLGVSTIQQVYHMNPVSPDMPADAAVRVLGGQGNLWSELIYAGKIAEYMIFPRLCALAEAVWTPSVAKDFDSFTRRLPVHQQRLERLGVLQYRGLMN